MQIINKDLTVEEFDKNKIILNISKIANMNEIKLSDVELNYIMNSITSVIKGYSKKDRLSYETLHRIIVLTLEEYNLNLAMKYEKYYNN